jgi:AAA domain-containing protein
MRIAISGSHGTGKSTLIAAFLARCPQYQHEAEAFELLGDDVELTSSEGPTADGLQMLLEHTMAALAGHGPDASVVFERSPVDYLAYAVASRSWPKGSAARFVRTFVPRVRRSLRSLDVIAFLAISPGGPRPRSGEDTRFRRRVDEALQRVLLDDDHDLFEDQRSPRVVALPAQPDRQLAELVRLTRAG